MSYSIKLLLPIALGIAAAMVNMAIMSSRVAPVDFVQVTRDIKVGEVFTDADLAVLPIAGNQAERLKKTAFDYTSVGKLIGRPAQRQFFDGDIVFFRDFEVGAARYELRKGERGVPVPLMLGCAKPPRLEIGDLVKLRFKTDPAGGSALHGPYRVVSIGDRIERQASESERQAYDYSTIMVAVDEQASDPITIAARESIDTFNSMRAEKDFKVEGIEFP
jgi:hypothetical protein